MITGLDDFVRELGQQILETAARAVLDDMVEDAPVDTGELRDSAYGPNDVGDLAVVVGFTAPQADYTDQGVSPHPILPVNARFLRFFWEDGPNGSGIYTFDQVFHPGHTGSNWFTEKVDAWDVYVDEAAEAA